MKCPEYGDLIVKKDEVIFIGTVRIRHIFRWIGRRKLIRWWWGTDALTLHRFPPGLSRPRVLLHRIKSRLLSPFMENWAISDDLRDELFACGYNCTRVKFPKIEHHKVNQNIFVVGYYRPNESLYSRWKYGIDIVEAIQKQYAMNGDLVFLEMNKRTISAVMSLQDVHIRPSRHDGKPRIVEACKRNRIPCYYDPNFNPTQEAVERFIALQLLLWRNTRVS